ncbi:MAG: type VI secretion system lipoprotein TssJ [Candidatus Delongbacteria bacterium]|nr:type VI secretion system lipoprotein TssJ [Candidatus Delongbacteria bacterium]
MKNMRWTVLIVTLLTLSGCAAKPTHLELMILSHSEINMDEDNVSSPLMLHFYELESAEQFSKFDYWTLMENATTKMNSDLISHNKHIIVPNEEQTYKILFSERARFLGVIGSFRELDSNNKWRYIINLDKESYNYSEVEIVNYTIEEAK